MSDSHLWSTPKRTDDTSVEGWRPERPDGAGAGPQPPTRPLRHSAAEQVAPAEPVDVADAAERVRAARAAEAPAVDVADAARRVRGSRARAADPSEAATRVSSRERRPVDVAEAAARIRNRQGPGAPLGGAGFDARSRPAPAAPTAGGGRPSWTAPAISALVGALLVLVVFLFVTRDDGGGGGTQEPLPASAGAGGRNADARTIYARASGSVVSVVAGGSGSGSRSTGTGFVVDDDETIVTNAHVVGNSDEVSVRFGDNGRMIRAEVLGRDVSTDLAVLRIDAGAHAAPALPLADSDDVQVGDGVVAIGNPFGLDRTATAGIVSATDRHISAPNGFDIDDVIQTDAPINPGNSGGPLLDARGRVIGVNSQIATSGASGGNVGIGFAVPSNTLREIVPQLKAGKTIRRPFLGVSTTSDPQGARVVEVVPSGPSDSAGLRVGDVIVGVDGDRVDKPDDVAAGIADNSPGDRVEVEIVRGGVRQSIDVRLGTRPDSG
jgi:putative serine protease PepD